MTWIFFTEGALPPRASGALQRRLLLAFACLVCACAPLAGAEGFTGRLTLTLPDALIQLPDRAPNPGNLKDLNVVATARDGAWDEVWGHALRFDKSQHRGAVRSIEREGDRLRIDLAMLIVGDAWIPGTAAIYDLDLRVDDGQVAGTYTGRCAYGPDGPVEVAGEVTGRLSPPPTPVDGFEPFAADEFPRLLLRRSDLPRLRERLATPFGQAVAARMEKSSNPICLGLMYQLTGDESYARRAVEPVRKKMAETGGGPFAIGRVWGYRAEYVAYAYDLCREAWDEDFNREVEGWIDWIAPRCIDRPWSLSSAVNITPGSNYMVVIWGGAGLAAITRIGAPGPAPEAPRDDFAEARAIAPPADWTPGEDVPVVDFTDRTMPRPWLWAGGWATAEMDDAEPLAALGGPGRAHTEIAPDATLAVEGRSFTIRKGDASLVGTVVSPAGALIEAGEEGGVAAGVGKGRKNRDGKTEFTFRGIRITGPEGDEGDFFVVMTLQRGDAPEVEIEGESLNAEARIGELLWRVDADEQRIEGRR